jgi:hypothetical protein
MLVVFGLSCDGSAICIGCNAGQLSVLGPTYLPLGPAIGYLSIYSFAVQLSTAGGTSNAQRLFGGGSPLPRPVSNYLLLIGKLND